MFVTLNKQRIKYCAVSSEKFPLIIYQFKNEKKNQRKKKVPSKCPHSHKRTIAAVMLCYIVLSKISSLFLHAKIMNIHPKKKLIQLLPKLLTIHYLPLKPARLYALPYDDILYNTICICARGYGTVYTTSTYNTQISKI